MKRNRLTYERSVPLLAVLSAVPAITAALIFLWTGDYQPKLQWTLSLVILGSWASLVIALRERLVRPLQTISNMLAALQEGDYSMRARLGGPEDSLGLVAFEVNTLGETLREQRLEVLEATALLRRVMEEIDVAVFSFDSENRLVLANRTAERLLGRSEESVRGRAAGSIGLAGLLRGETPRVVDHAFAGGTGRWEVRIRHFRQDGRPHRLLVLSDVGRALRDEERKAWQKIVRVLGHEINNSLAPIQSIAHSLQSTLDRNERDGEWADDLRQGLNVISGRSEALARFMSSYARLARLPPPKFSELDVGTWVHRVAKLETRLPIEVEEGPPVTIHADGDQLDQLLINLVDNAVDAALETGGGVRVGWSGSSRRLELRVEDEGPGVSGSANLFVPFYTTKADGSGIGLVLSRQIAEAHHGALTLANRPGGSGCVAKLELPVG